MPRDSPRMQNRPADVCGSDESEQLYLAVPEGGILPLALHQGKVLPARGAPFHPCRSARGCLPNAAGLHSASSLVLHFQCVLETSETVWCCQSPHW